MSHVAFCQITLAIVIIINAHTEVQLHCIIIIPISNQSYYTALRHGP